MVSEPNSFLHSLKTSSAPSYLPSEDWGVREPEPQVSRHLTSEILPGFPSSYLFYLEGGKYFFYVYTDLSNIIFEETTLPQ